MNLLSNFSQLPTLWVVVIAIIAILLVIKIIRSVVGKALSLVFTGISLFKLYLFLSGKH